MLSSAEEFIASTFLLCASRAGRPPRGRLSISISLIVSDVSPKLCSTSLLVQFLGTAGGRLQQNKPCLNGRLPAERQTARTNTDGEKVSGGIYK